MKRRYYFVVFILTVLIFSGCSSVRPMRVDTLDLLYAKQRNEPKKTPVIFIHGILGSVLKDPKSGRVIWGKAHEGSLEDLALPIDGNTIADNRDTLQPTDIVAGFSLFGGLVNKDIYRTVKDVSIKAGGYVPNHDAFALVYDWRRDLVETAKELDKLIEGIKKQRQDPDLKFTLLCHSMGGLVARYYAKYGGVDVLDQNPMPAPTYAGAKNIEKIIMLGTPNRGSLLVFKRLHRGLHLPTICSASAETIFTLPSSYELLPPPGEQVFVDRDGKPLEVDLYEPLNWEKYGWSVFNPHEQEKVRRELVRENGESKGGSLYKERLEKQRRFLKLVLERTKRFHEALWNGDLKEEGRRVTYVLLGADTQPTPKRAILEKDNSGWQVRFKSGDGLLTDILYSFGDEDVTKESFLGVHKALSEGAGEKASRLPSAYEVFISEKHDALADNPTYLDNILHVLLDD